LAFKKTIKLKTNEIFFLADSDVRWHWQTVHQCQLRKIFYWKFHPVLTCIRVKRLLKQENI